jgi:hypothetical protein
MEIERYPADMMLSGVGVGYLLPDIDLDIEKFAGFYLGRTFDRRYVLFSLPVCALNDILEF